MNAVSSVTKSMAATPQLSSRAPQREDCTGSADSVTTPNSVPTVSPVSPEPVSPGQVAEPPGKNLWEQICEEYEAELPSFPEGYIIKHENPVIVSLLEELISHDFNTEQYFPASQFITASNIPCPQNKSETVDPKTCSPREYLETFIFPVLLPGMASLLHQAKQEKCFEPKSKEDKGAVHGILLHPMCRGMAKVPVRCDPEIQELRQWQKKLWEDKHIHQKVQMFWAKQEQKVKCKMEDQEVPRVKITSP
ncbi:IQ domain-containing protein K isoform X8 [Cavia porcellus]|uniref:IQ domain-containing protein K isoform X8 n=1 Tax=Cavia porcellus TaxID=10141 RepID=UPI002FE3DD86